MNYCSECGAAVELRTPPGDTLPRHVCTKCEAIHYQNPKIVVGCIVAAEDSILLCRRAIEPRSGLWTLPAGFMENAESTAQAAMRETFEEACARVDIDALFALVSIPGIDQVHLFYRGHLRDAQHAAGPESLETALFREDEIPWGQLAFRSVEYCLRAYLADQHAGSFGFHETELPPLKGY
ncbi:MAG: NUDIX hydrolase [Propionivibrio sp.]